MGEVNERGRVRMKLRYGSGDPAQPRAVLCCGMLWSCLIGQLMGHEREPQTLERTGVWGKQDLSLADPQIRILLVLFICTKIICSGIQSSQKDFARSLCAQTVLPPFLSR